MSRKALVREIEASFGRYSAEDVMNLALDFGVQLAPRSADALVAKLARAKDPHATLQRFLDRCLAACSR